MSQTANMLNRRRYFWSRRVESNHRPAVYENDSVGNCIQQQDTLCHCKPTTIKNFCAQRNLAFYSVASPNRD